MERIEIKPGAGFDALVVSDFDGDDQKSARFFRYPTAPNTRLKIASTCLSCRSTENVSASFS